MMVIFFDALNNLALFRGPVLFYFIFSPFSFVQPSFCRRMVIPYIWDATIIRRVVDLLVILYSTLTTRHFCGGSDLIANVSQVRVVHTGRSYYPQEMQIEG